MKKKTIICSVLLAVGLAGGIIYGVLKREKVKTFSLNDNPIYVQAIQDFPSDKCLGEISTASEAKEKAIDEWTALFGEKIKDEKPYQVFWDEQNNVWLVKGSLARGRKGGVAYILIRKSDGKILAIWHDQ